MFLLSYLSHGFHALAKLRLFDTLSSRVDVSRMGMWVALLRVTLPGRRMPPAMQTRTVLALFALVCGLGLIGVPFLSSSHPSLADGFAFGIALAIVATLAVALFPGLKATAMMDASASARSDRTAAIPSDCSRDSLFVLQSVYSKAGALVDFRFIYPNTLDALEASGIQTSLAGKLLCADSPIDKSKWLYEKCKSVVQCGKTFTHEVSTAARNRNSSWLRYRVMKFNDGVAISTTNIGNNLNATRNLAFDKAFTISSPFAIIAVSLDGTVTEMNPAAERMLWYDKDEVVGRKSLFIFHDSHEVAQRAVELSEEFGSQVDPGMDVFKIIADRGLTADTEWTYVRRDGSRLDVQLIVSPLADEEGNMFGILSVAYDITERKRVEEHISHIAHHDALTGLPTRTLLHDRLHVALTRAQRNQRSIALLMVDLDNFKRINDTIGHHAGDAVLVSIANRLRASLRRSDTVARMGGDEFVVMLEDIHSVEEAEQITQKLLDAIGLPITIHSETHSITASIGVCIYPERAEDDQTLLRNADAAMYCAKSEGRNSYQVFSESMASASNKKRIMQNALDCALAQNEFSLVYQPQISLSRGEVIGIEALIRWTSKKIGAVAPNDFIPVAEETGLIVPIGEWVIRTACRQAAQFNSSLGRPIVLAVNLSPRQFQQDNLDKVIEEALAQSGLEPPLLELEITENILVSDSPKTIRALDRIRDLGVRVSIDDFGTGFSSMAYILRFKVDRIKIDRSFISNINCDPNSGAVAHAIIALAHGLRINVIAEGVETSEVCDVLLNEGCDEAQGFYYSQAVSMDRLLSVVNSIEALQENNGGSGDDSPDTNVFRAAVGSARAAMPKTRADLVLP
jgi:diguanylate cyclase (GGDEF)-like protein/PAS domain S-box-containing protein